MKVLVAGYRKPLIETLTRMGIPFSVWHDRNVKLPPGLEEVLLKPFPQSKKRIAQVLEPVEKWGPFTHVIAAVERAVYSASIARRVLGARKSSHTTILRCFDKLKMKQFLVARNVSMTPFLHLRSDAQIADALDVLGSPVVVKGRKSSGGRGIRVHTDSTELQRDVNQRKIVEAWVPGEEVSVESYVTGNAIRFTNITQYYRKGRINILPGDIDLDIGREILALNEKVIGDLNIQWGITHMEVYLTEKGIMFGEIAIRPPGGYIMDLLGLAYGFNAWEALVRVETDQPFEFPAGHTGFAAAVLLTPGEGVVARISGEQQVRKHPHVVSATLKVKPGKHIAPRESVGNDSGVVLLQAPSRHELMDAIHFVEKTLRIEMEN